MYKRKRNENEDMREKQKAKKSINVAMCLATIRTCLVYVAAICY